MAHRGALDAGGGTVGILGNGLGVVYPSANRALYDHVPESGCLLTEFPPGERPNAGSFPRRNRLISGLARCTVVIEARERSGTLITVECALQQGREVLAVPGPITSPISVGCNRLIQHAQGAQRAPPHEHPAHSNGNGSRNLRGPFVISPRNAATRCAQEVPKMFRKMFRKSVG